MTAQLSKKATKNKKKTTWKNTQSPNKIRTKQTNPAVRNLSRKIRQNDVVNSAERGGHYRLRTESETKQKNKWKTNSFFFFLSLSLSLFPTKPRPVRRRKQRRSDSIRYNSLNETIQLTWNENENEQKQIGQSWSSIKWNFQKNNKENGPSKLKQFSKTCFEHQVKKKKKRVTQ